MAIRPVPALLWFLLNLHLQNGRGSGVIRGRGEARERRRVFDLLKKKCGQCCSSSRGMAASGLCGLLVGAELINMNPCMEVVCACISMKVSNT